MLGANAAALLHAFAMKRHFARENILIRPINGGKVLRRQIALQFQTIRLKHFFHLPEESLYKNITEVR